MSSKVEQLTTTNELIKEDLSICQKSLLKSQEENRRLHAQLQSFISNRCVLTGISVSEIEFLGGLSWQTPSFSFTQSVTAYQFLGSRNIVLSRPENFEVGNCISVLALKWPTEGHEAMSDVIGTQKLVWIHDLWKLIDGVCLENPPQKSRLA